MSNHIQELVLYMEDLILQNRSRQAAITKNGLRSSYTANYSGADQKGDLDKTRQTASLIFISQGS